VLWRYLARARSGSPTAAAELEIDAERALKQPDWPFPVVELFLGHRTPEATLEASTNSGNRCEAQFYVGEWLLLQGDRPAAMAALKMAAETCSKTFYEYGLAQAELHRLGQ
jgi:lipoprotein NlpI